MEFWRLLQITYLSILWHLRCEEIRPRLNWTNHVLSHGLNLDHPVRVWFISPTEKFISEEKSNSWKLKNLYCFITNPLSFRRIFFTVRVFFNFFFINNYFFKSMSLRGHQVFGGVLMDQRSLSPLSRTVLLSILNFRIKFDMTV